MTARPLFDRDCRITVGPVVIPSRIERPTGAPTPVLRTRFSIEKTEDNSPNSASIEIYNLTPQKRTSVQFKGLPVTVDAGYMLRKDRLFFGSLEWADSRRDGADWVTVLEARDGQFEFGSRRLNQSFGPGTTLQSLLQVCAAALGLGPGNSAVKFATPRRGLVAFKTGAVVNGRISDILDKYVTAAGYTWSIQDGQLQVLAPDETTIEEMVSLTETTGLIGAPEKGEDGSITARALLQGAIRPGRQVLIFSQQVEKSGRYKVGRTQYVGDTWGQDWYTEFEGKAATV
jgi:hypothetical protein